MPSIDPVMPDEPEAQSADPVVANLAALRTLFPDAFTEGKVDFESLRQLLGDAVDDSEEKYGLNWSGKRRARHLALTPSLGTLRPARDDSVDWDATRNLMIEGDNLEVLKLLQKSYAGRVKAIYIDPPYNTGRDILYPNDYSEGVRAYLEVTGQVDGDQRLTSNPKTDGRHHSNWLTLMYPRLLVARTLLSKDGVLICTIDENELVNLSAVIEEVFDEATFEHVCVTIVHNPRGIQGTNFSYTHEYALFVFRKGAKLINDRRIEQSEVDWSQFRNWGTESERHDARNCFYPVLVRDGQIIGFGDVAADAEHPKQTETRGETVYVYPIDRSGVERKWRYARQSVDAIHSMLRAKKARDGYEIEIGKTFAQYKTVWTDPRYDANEYGTGIVGSLVPGSPFTFPKSLWAVYDCLIAAVGSDKEAVILDFFAGSGTTGHAVMQLNQDDGGCRRFILVQLPEPITGNPNFTDISQVTRARLRAAGDKISAANVDGVNDVGFRAYKLDSSNLKVWQPRNGDDETLAADLLDAADNLLPGRTEDDLLTELLLKQGLDLSEPMETKTIAGEPVHAIGGGVLLVCLGEVGKSNAEAMADGIADWRAELNPVAPTTIFFKDKGFADDVAKLNVAKILEQRLGDGLLRVRSV